MLRHPVIPRCCRYTSALAKIYHRNVQQADEQPHHALKDEHILDAHVLHPRSSDESNNDAKNVANERDANKSFAGDLEAVSVKLVARFSHRIATYQSVTINHVCEHRVAEGA